VTAVVHASTPRTCHARSVDAGWTGGCDLAAPCGGSRRTGTRRRIGRYDARSSTIAGWSSSYALVAGTPVAYAVDVTRSTGGLAGLWLPAIDGTTTSLFEVSGSVTP
jgi:hypothetical protein